MLNTKNTVGGFFSKAPDVLLSKKGPGFQVKVVREYSGRVQGYIRRNGESYRAIAVKGLSNYLSIEQVEPARQMLKASDVAFYQGHVEIKPRGAGNMPATLSDDGTLDLARKSIEEVRESLEKHFNIEHSAIESLVLSGTDVTDDDLNKLPGSDTLKYLFLEQCQHVSTRGISNVLEKHSGIERLLLKDNEQLRPDGLIELFRNGQNLIFIDFKWCNGLRLKETMLKEIAEETMIFRENEFKMEIHTPSGKIENICKPNNLAMAAAIEAELRGAIPDANVRDEVSDLIKNAARVTCFALPEGKNVELGIKVLSALARVLEQPECYLEVLDLSQRQIDNQAGLSILAYSLSKNRTLKSLNLSNISMSPMLSGTLANTFNVLKRIANPTLEELYLCNNSINDEEMRVLADALRGHPTLKILKFTGNLIKNKGAEAISNMMVQTRSIEKISVAENRIGDKGMQKLKDIVRQHPSLQRLVVGRNRISCWMYLSLVITRKIHDNWD